MTYLQHLISDKYIFVNILSFFDFQRFVSTLYPARKKPDVVVRLLPMFFDMLFTHALLHRFIG